jgi:hypothetical protein
MSSSSENSGASSGFAPTPGSASSFSATLKNYPNGTTYLVIERGKVILGTCVKRGAGFLVVGKRKPVPTILHAAHQMINDRLNACVIEETRWRKILCALRNECGPLPPNIPR